MLTDTELAVKILRKAQVLDHKENPTAAEATDTIEIMYSIYNGLKEPGKAQFSLPNIPSRFLDPFITFVAWHIAEDFGVSGSVTGARAAKAERDIYIQAQRVTDERLEPLVDF